MWTIIISPTKAFLSLAFIMFHALKLAVLHYGVFTDGGQQFDCSDSQLEDQDDLSGASEEESVSYSAPIEGTMSRDTSEPLFEADFTTTPPDPQPDTEDLLGLNSEPSPPAATTQPGIANETGLKSSASNSDLLNDLFAPPPNAVPPANAEDLMGESAGEDLFFSNTSSQQAPTANKGKRDCECLNVATVMSIVPWSNPFDLIFFLFFR